MILPFLSRINVVGIVPTPNELLAFPSESNRATKAKFCVVKKSLTVETDSCKFTASMAKSEILNLLYNFCIEGISSRQD